MGTKQVIETVHTLVEGDLDGGSYVRRSEGVKVNGEGWTMPLSPVVRVVELNPSHLLWFCVLHQLYLPWLLQKRWIVVHICYIHL